MTPFWETAARVIGAALIAAGVLILFANFLGAVRAADSDGSRLRVAEGLTEHGLFAQNMNSGAGSSDLPILGGKPGPAAPATFLKLEGGGFILLEAGGKLKCESC